MAPWKAQLAAVLAFVSVSLSSTVVPLAPRAVVVDSAAGLKAEYDYVVIGGGTSGLVVANRLTEDPASECPNVEPGEAISRALANADQPTYSQCTCDRVRLRVRKHCPASPPPRSSLSRCRLTCFQ